MYNITFSPHLSLSEWLCCVCRSHPFTLMSTNLSTHFAGIYQVLNPPNDWERPEDLEVADDLEGEQETVLKAQPGDQEDKMAESEDVPMSYWQDNLLQASKGVTENTDISYQRSFYFFSYICETVKKWQPGRLMKQCQAFLVQEGIIKPNDTFFSSTPSKDAPWCIAAWIMNQ